MEELIKELIKEQKETNLLLAKNNELQIKIFNKLIEIKTKIPT